MAYEFLKNLFGKNEDGTPAALTADQLEAAITANKEISVVDLKAGGYVIVQWYHPCFSVFFHFVQSVSRKVNNNS